MEKIFIVFFIISSLNLFHFLYYYYLLFIFFSFFRSLYLYLYFNFFIILFHLIYCYFSLFFPFILFPPFFSINLASISSSAFAVWTSVKCRTLCNHYRITFSSSLNVCPYRPVSAWADDELYCFSYKVVLLCFYLFYFMWFYKVYYFNALNFVENFIFYKQKTFGLFTKNVNISTNMTDKCIQTLNRTHTVL